MDNKLSELSKPVGFVSKQAQVLLKSGDTASVRPFFDVQGSSPLYSQEYVSALLAELEIKNREINVWRQRCENAEKGSDHSQQRIAELERANQSQDDHINQQQDRIDSLEKKNGDLGRSLGAAEKRLATPVRLPNKNDDEFWFDNVFQVAKFDRAVERAIRAAGFTVEGDE
ncbi:hypothetical protein [Serratia marcescens]|uniref:hypothetical protein n=1 Tax=Serratia marcescens TaxID=615 RepID=UPI0007452A73|nr:hypothetical protein [Serratia marcescens]CVA10790.1 Uncharacterised protein [Serratia marcescens]CVE08126.1 Uncharacterised protein [Serratia marcescens]CVE70106.1 Uncharacterised protein [Serratia marcescens]CVF99020.1 Uncharacterised protein [Serratia marcescens]CVH05956.1 Uncharacterised protein [Serratia marcescens]